LKTGAVAAVPSVSQSKEKAPSKADAPQIAIGAKKEDDFPSWYTDVGSSVAVTTCVHLVVWSGSAESRHVRLLQCQWMLHS
jgi:hypothetical protein